MLLISSFVKYTVNNLVIIFIIDIKVLHKFLLNIIYIITSLTATQYTFYLNILSTNQYTFYYTKHFLLINTLSTKQYTLYYTIHFLPRYPFYCTIRPLPYYT